MSQSHIPALLEVAFNNGFHHTDETGTEFTFLQAELGNIFIHAGRIIACDPFLYDENPPINMVFPIGKFPVQLSIANIRADERVAFARIQFSESRPVRWEMALTDDQDLATLPPDEIYGYSVDGGIGAFMDASGAQELKRYLTEVEDNYEVLLRELNRNQKDTWTWNIWMRNNCNAPMFSTGWGDGFYASYIGYDAGGRICRLVTDFEVMA